MEQTETDRQDGNSPDGAESGAGTSDLETLIKGFKANQTTTSDELKPVLDFVKTEMETKQREAVNTDLASATAVLKKNASLKDLPDKLLRGLMETYAQDDPSFVEAFENRGKDAKAWEAKLEEGAKFASELIGSIPGSKVRTDIEAAAAAVDGTSTEAPDNAGLPSQEELNAMSIGDLKKLAAEQAAGA